MQVRRSAGLESKTDRQQVAHRLPRRRGDGGPATRPLSRTACVSWFLSRLPAPMPRSAVYQLTDRLCLFDDQRAVEKKHADLVT